MSLRLRRSIKIAPGIKLNLTKSGLGLTAGTRGAHYSEAPTTEPGFATPPRAMSTAASFGQFDRAHAGDG